MIAKLNANLNESALVYSELISQSWWKALTSINGVYVEIRKKDIVDVYFEGGRVAEFKYKYRGLVAECHNVYLDKGNKGYSNCLDVLKASPNKIIDKIKSKYSQKKGVANIEDFSEKKIQGDIICKKDPVYLDSEFAHRFEVGETPTIRFDLVKIENNQLVFVELKRIQDNRMLDEVGDKPEILNQMNNYAKFINENSKELVEYYKTLYKIKKAMGLPVPVCDDIDSLGINLKPHLLICNLYQRSTLGRENRINRIKGILDKNSSVFTSEFFKI